MVARQWSSSRFPVESASFEMRRERREGTPPLELGGGNVAHMDVGRTLVLPLEWRRVCGELLELQQGCEGPFGSSRG